MNRMLPLVITFVAAAASPALATEPLPVNLEDLGDGRFVVTPDELPGEAIPVDVLPPQANIVNGELAQPGEYPETVHLRMSSGSGCTGSLIHPEYVLTAAHCVDDEDITGITVTFGTSVNDPNRVEVTASEWDWHTGWGGTETDPNDIQGAVSFDDDIAWVKLAAPVTDVAVMPLNTSLPTRDWVDSRLEFIGFGITEFQGTGSGIKRYAEEPIIGYSSDVSEDDDPPRYLQIYSFDGTTSTCQGDSGGPGVFKSPGGYIQATITSYGIGCGAGRSGHVNVQAYIQWLLSDASGGPSVPSIVTRPGAPPSFRCNYELDPDNETTVALGGVPMDMKCRVLYGFPDKVVAQSIDWGDGTVDDGINFSPDHTYTTPGNYTVFVKVSYEADTITATGSTTEIREHTIRRYAYVRACGTPDAEFTYTQTGPRRVQLQNRTDLSTYGCLYEVQWDIFEGETASGEPVVTVDSWAPELTLDAAGVYTAQLHVGGLAGTGAAELSFRVTNTEGVGCSSAGGLGLGFGFALLGGLAVRRRRD